MVQQGRQRGNFFQNMQPIIRNQGSFWSPLYNINLMHHGLVNNTLLASPVNTANNKSIKQQANELHFINSLNNDKHDASGCSDIPEQTVDQKSELYLESIISLISSQSDQHKIFGQEYLPSLQIMEVDRFFRTTRCLHQTSINP